MKELELVYKSWRGKLLFTNFLLTMLLCIVEILMFFILREQNLIEQPFEVYFQYFLFRPTFINLMIVLIGFIVIKLISPQSVYINYIPILQMATICMVIASTHNIFSVSLCLLCFPLFATIMFSDKRMTRIIGIVSLLFQIITLLTRKFSAFKPKSDPYFYSEAFVAVAILGAAYILCYVLIKFSEEKTSIIHNSYLEQIEMKELLNRDQKTGLFSHSIFMNTLDQMVDIAHNTTNTFAVAVIDIDDFKKINDTYGHLKGDQILIILAEIMKKLFGDNQFVARYGGEEFAIIFSEDELLNGMELLEKLRKAVKSYKFDCIDTMISISIGFAHWKKGWTSEQLFEAADNAMYQSKLGGKNRITVYEGNEYCPVFPLEA